MQWTAEQNAIFEDGLAGSGHTIITARAGAAKTSSMVELAQRLPAKSRGLALAFNASIRDELKARLPANFRAMTLNGCGFEAWRRFIRKPTKVDKDKTYNLFTEVAAELEKAESDEVWEKFGELRKAVSMAKNAGYLPVKSAGYRPLVDGEDFYNFHLDINATELEREVIDEILKRSWRMTLEGILDFDDMLLAPAVAGVGFDHYDFVLVDESQDLSAINHVLLKKVVRGTTRLIAVGDPCQAIYGFRGADSSSMETLRRLFSAKELFLTTSFRCSRAVCENARWRAPDMNSPEWAAEGEVRTLPGWSSEDIPDGAAIICRNNAPLFAIAIRLIRAGRYPELKGRDIIKGLITKMRKLGPGTLTREEALKSLAGWEAAEKLRQKDKHLVSDQADCMRLFINETETLKQACAFAEGLSQQTGRLHLMTGHGSKGLEYDHVFFLDQHLIDIKRGQDNNVKYVIETRAKLTLTYITSEGFADDQKETDGDAAVGVEA